MKTSKTNTILTKINKKNKKIGKFFVLFVFFSFFLTIILISNVFANFLNVKNFGLFSENVNAKSHTFYCLAYGNYESENSALIQADYIKQKGGAGYIYKIGNSYTILLSAYLDENSCKNVYETNKNNLDIHIEKLSTQKTNYSYNKTTDISSLKDMINLKLDVFNALHEISNKFDAGEYLSQKVYNELFNLTYEVNQKIETFKNTSMLTSSIDYNNLIMEAQNIYSKLNTLILNTPKNNLSQNIKYYALDIILL